MPLAVKLTLEDLDLFGHLDDSPAARAVAGLLPLEVGLKRWGDEYFGDVGQPVGPLSGDTREVMDLGELAFWDWGNAFCLFFGPTPASQAGEPRAVGPVHPVGKVEGDWQAVRALGPQVMARLERA
jgi:hypothetical protein